MRGGEEKRGSGSRVKGQDGERSDALPLVRMLPCNHTHISLSLSLPAQGFDWEALSSRSMEPPRKPKDEDSAKRKQELTDAQRQEPKEPTATEEEMAEWEKTFHDF